MQRRTFLSAAALTVGTALPLAAATAAASTASRSEESARQLIELRTYEFRFGGSGESPLREYLAGALSPALVRLGCPPLQTLRPLGGENPGKLVVLVTYPDAATYVAAQDLSGDAGYQAAAAAYRALPVERPVYNRYASSLLLAFTGMPEVEFPGADAGLFELRTYEGYSEDAVDRKVKMFNVEELPLFHAVGLHPVFFGEMISGPHRPSLVYMLHFRDMAERDANWKTFVDHPDWKRMSAKPEYANSVSNIRRVFLEPLA